MDVMHTALETLRTVGPYALAVALLLASMGIPLPVSLMMIAAGAWVREGRFSGPLVFMYCLIGGTIGNTLSYYMGQYGLKGLINRLKKGKSWGKAQKFLQEKGAVGVFLTRWLVTPLSLPTNLIAGGERFPLPKFLAASIAGQIVWTLIYGGLGYAFGKSWRTVAEQAARFSGWIGAIVVLFIAYRVFLYWRERKNSKESRPVDSAEAKPVA